MIEDLCWEHTDAGRLIAMIVCEFVILIAAMIVCEFD